MEKLEPGDVILFRNGIPVFPTLVCCPQCHSLRSVTISSSIDGPVKIDDPELAQKCSLVEQGYNLRVNEERAARGVFRSMDGHDGWPDDWQNVEVRPACKCASANVDADIQNAEKAA